MYHCSCTIAPQRSHMIQSETDRGQYTANALVTFLGVGYNMHPKDILHVFFCNQRPKMCSPRVEKMHQGSLVPGRRADAKRQNGSTNKVEGHMQIHLPPKQPSNPRGAHTRDPHSHIHRASTATCPCHCGLRGHVNFWRGPANVTY